MLPCSPRSAVNLVELAAKTGIMDKNGHIPRVKEAMMSDAIGTTISSMLGSSTVMTYIESASGIAEGGRSGVTSFVTGLLFILVLFFCFRISVNTRCGDNRSFCFGRRVYDGFYR